MAPDQDDAVLPEGDLSTSSQDEEEDDDVVDEDEEEDYVDDDDDDVINSASPSTSSAGGAADSLPVAIATATPTVTVALPARAPPTVPLTLASAPTTVIANDAVLSSDPKRQPALSSQPEEKKSAVLDDSRRLFQRLWTDEDEIELLQGFLDYTTQRGSRGSHQGPNDTALFYDQIKCKLQLDFNKNQLVEKLRRLKKKYRNVVTKIESGKDVSFKSPHDQATFEISRKIWSNIGRIGAADENALDDEDPSPNPNNPNFNSYEIKAEEPAGFAGDKKSTPRSRKRSRIQPRADEKPPPPPLRGGLVEPTPVIKDTNNSINSNNGGAGGGNNGSNCNVHGLIEETVKSCLSPLFKELLSNAMGVGPSRGFGGLAFNPIPLSFGGPLMNLNFGGGEVADDKWRKQQILELEVYSKRLDLVQNQIKVALDELRSNGG